MYKRLELEVDYQDDIKLPNIKIKHIENNPFKKDQMLIDVKNEVSRVVKFFDETKIAFDGEYVLLDRLALSLRVRLTDKFSNLLTNKYNDYFYRLSDLNADIKSIKVC